MNLSEVTYPKDTKNRVQNLLVQEARRTPKPTPQWRKPAMLTFAGLALAGTTAAGVYVSLAPVEDKRDIRCYYHADITTRMPVIGSPGETRPPYITTGTFIAGFDTENNPNPDDRNAGMKQINDPINQCSKAWDIGTMNQSGETDDLIPDGFVSPPQGPRGDRIVPEDANMDQNGNPLYPGPDNLALGHYVPFLTPCVVDNTVAVIPGPAEVCARLGIPALEK
ncbi:hypothetical protein [Arthrobacter sp. Leaf69]|uniref:hypothetical protein n=1 Tax=Arthrobacter sp. Leaf69 TaxID=1736232 RepID=UPI0006F45BD1|nr:hypothetical protein [Arthrobacter sp. Leaf69]KQN91239.1 hypothetical protein ASE96_18185 [Arthrobacter sp. Leaf69]